MTYPETIFEDKEHEYRIAGWIGTIGVMQSMASLCRPLSIRDKSHNAFILEVCTLMKDNEDVKAKFNEWTADMDKNEDRIGALQNADIAHNRQLSVDFVDAYGTFTDAEWQEYLVKETDFDRLLPIIDELRRHYAPKKLEPGITQTLQRIRRDIEFYAGQYDPNR